MKAMQCWMPAKPWEKNALALQKSMKFARHMHLLPLRQQPRLDNCTVSLRLEFSQKIVPKAISIGKPQHHFLSKLYMHLIQAGQLITSLTSPIRSKWISITSALNLLKHAWSSGHIFGWIQSISTSNLYHLPSRRMGHAWKTHWWLDDVLRLDLQLQSHWYNSDPSSTHTPFKVEGETSSETSLQLHPM